MIVAVNHASLPVNSLKALEREMLENVVAMVINAARSQSSRWINLSPEKAYAAQMAKINARATVSLQK